MVAQRPLATRLRRSLATSDLRKADIRRSEWQRLSPWCINQDLRELSQPFRSRLYAFRKIWPESPLDSCEYGHHLGMFRLPTHPRKTYHAANCCIYCSSKATSDEHIIPLGLGGRWVLPNSSCADCAKKTGASERTCQRTMLGHFRMYYDLPTRRRKERPKKLPLKVRLTPEAEWTFINVDQKIFPFLILFPLLDMPDELSGKTTTGERGAVVRQLWIRAASFRDGIIPHLEALAAELKVAAIEPTGTVSAPEFFRMLAKIAHAFAVAEMGTGSFSPFLSSMICDSDTSNSAQYIGGLQHQEPATTGVHELSFGSHTSDRADIVTVRIRLFAALGTPYLPCGSGSAVISRLGRPSKGSLGHHRFGIILGGLPDYRSRRYCHPSFRFLFYYLGLRRDQGCNTSPAGCRYSTGKWCGLAFLAFPWGSPALRPPLLCLRRLETGWCSACRRNQKDRGRPQRPRNCASISQPSWSCADSRFPSAWPNLRLRSSRR
jgi:hypothetical protein